MKPALITVKGPILCLTCVSPCCDYIDLFGFPTVVKEYQALVARLKVQIYRLSSPHFFACVLSDFPIGTKIVGGPGAPLVMLV